MEPEFIFSREAIRRDRRRFSRKSRIPFKLKNVDLKTRGEILAELDPILSSYKEDQLEMAMRRRSMEKVCKPERARGK